MSRRVISLCTALIILNAAACPAEPEGESQHRKLGLRLGYLYSNSDIKIQFGQGSVIQLYFTEKIKPPLYATISLGALYLGKSASDYVTHLLFGPSFSDANMRILSVTVGPTVELPFYNDGTLYLSGGAGLYSVSVLLGNLVSGNLSNDHFGVNLGAGYYWPLGVNWKLDVNFTFHHFWTPEINKDLSTWSPIVDPHDLFWLYSYGDSDPNFYQISIGAAFSLN
jgi:hypothetical protein